MAKDQNLIIANRVYKAGKRNLSKKEFDAVFARLKKAEQYMVLLDTINANNKALGKALEHCIVEYHEIVDKNMKEWWA